MIKKAVKRLKNIGGKRLVIFPYGMYGQMVENVLANYYHIKPDYIIDNGLAKTRSDIHKVDYLDSISGDKCVLFCCVNEGLRDTLLEMLLKHVEKDEVLDVFAGRPGNNRLFQRITASYNACWLQRHHKMHFLYRIKDTNDTKVLDVGCGNHSASVIKSVCPNIFYTGIDVGDYNQSSESKDLMDDYRIVSGEKFADEIASFDGTQDIVISNHNIEHTNDPDACLKAMAKALKKGGRIFMAFPSEMSVLFPHRGGTLNFYDDETHVNLMDFEHVCNVLKESGIKITFSSSSMRGWYLKRVGKSIEDISIAIDRVLPGTWDYWGFEAIIWGIKR